MFEILKIRFFGRLIEIFVYDVTKISNEEAFSKRLSEERGSKNLMTSLTNRS